MHKNSKHIVTAFPLCTHRGEFDSPNTLSLKNCQVRPKRLQLPDGFLRIFPGNPEEYALDQIPPRELCRFQGHICTIHTWCKNMWVFRFPWGVFCKGEISSV